MADWLGDLSPGQWFTSGTDLFEIVGVDPQGEIVLVQYFDGSLEEWDFDSWLESSARPCAPPHELSGALDLPFPEDDVCGAAHPELAPFDALLDRLEAAQPPRW